MNFSDLAQIKGSDVERPKTIPAGHYQAVISGPMKEHKAKSGNTAMRFPIKLTAPGEDVDQEALEQAGGIPEKREFTIDFWMSPEARWRFTNFAKSLGISQDLNLIDMAEEVANSGAPIIVEGKHSTSQTDPENVFINFDNPVAA